MHIKTSWLKLSTFALVFILAVSLNACSKKEAVHGYGSTSSDKNVTAKMQAALPATEPSLNITRKIITTHDITLEVSGFEEAFRKIAKIAQENGGYTTATNRSTYDNGTPSGEIKMRVPLSKADTVLEEIRKLGKIRSEGSSGEDITDQYIDLEARLKNERAAESRLLAIMQKNTAKVADIIVVENELTRVRGEIESMVARIRNWDLQTQTVAINVSVQTQTSAMPAFGRVWRPIRTAFRDGAEGFAESLHWVIVFIGAAAPWLALIIIFYFLLFKVIKRKKVTAEKSEQ